MSNHIVPSLFLFFFVFPINVANSDGFADLQRSVNHLVERVNALEIDNSRLRQELEQLKQDRDCNRTCPDFGLAHTHEKTIDKRQILPQKQVAFFATISAQNQSHLGVGQNIVFDHNVTNVGNAYHPSHGIFIAPHDGVYVFFSTIVGHRPDDESISYASFNMKGSTVARLQGQNKEQSSQMIVVSLKTNDEVSVQSDQVDSSIIGANFASFSGFLLYSLDKPVYIVG